MIEDQIAPARPKRNAEATKARILEAATHEFARFGIAGARIDRIAAEARANKQLIYFHFGSKQELFSIVLGNAFRKYSDATPFDAFDLPRYVGAYFDAVQQDHELFRLILWARLERTGPQQSPVFHDEIEGVRAAQDAGYVRDDLDPADLLALVRSLALGWALLPEGLARFGQTEDAAGDVERHRRAAVEATRLLIAPESRGEG